MLIAYLGIQCQLTPESKNYITLMMSLISHNSLSLKSKDKTLN